MIQTPTEAFGQRMFERSAAQILDNVGFHSATEPVLEILGLLAKRYFEDLCKRIAFHKENAGRENVTISDVTLGYKDQFIDLEDLHTYVLQVGTFDTNVQVPEYPVKLKCDTPTQDNAPEIAKALLPRAKEPVEVTPRSPRKVEIFSAPQKPILPNFTELSFVDMGFAGFGLQGPVIVPAEPLKSSKGKKRSSDIHRTPPKQKTPARTTKTAVKRGQTSPAYRPSGHNRGRPTKMVSEPVISKTKYKILTEVTTMDRFAEFAKRRKAEMLGSPRTRSKDNRNKKAEIPKKVETRSATKRRSRSQTDEATPEKLKSPRKEAIDTFMQVFGNGRVAGLSENGGGTVKSRSAAIGMEKKLGSGHAAFEHDKVEPLKIRIPIQEYTKFLEESDDEDDIYFDENSTKEKKKKHKNEIRENESCSDKEKRYRRREERYARKEAKRKRRMKRLEENGETMSNVDGTQNGGHGNGKKKDDGNGDTADSGCFDDSIFKKPDLPPWRQHSEFYDPFECFKVITSELDGLKLKLSLMPRESDEYEDSL